jgi:hypothetical protein
MTTQTWNTAGYDKHARFVTALLPLAEREDYLECVRERIKPHLCGANGNWTADYVRLRFEAHLLESSERTG